MPIVSPPVPAPLPIMSSDVVEMPAPNPLSAVRYRSSIPASPPVRSVPLPLPASPPALSVPAGYRTPGRIAVRIDVAPTSAGRRPTLAMPPVPALPSIPIVDVRPIGSIHPASPVPRQPMLAAAAEQVLPSQAQYGISVPGGPGTVPVRPSRPNYLAMTPAQQEDMHTTFRTKFGILRQSFPQWNIVDPPPSATLDQKHDIYEGHVRQIIVSLNCNQWKVYLVIMFLAIEVFCIKVLGLDARGFTMSQVKIMNRYDQVLVELGEKYYVQGPSNWPVEARIIMMAAFNGIVFIAVKYLSKWLGGDAMSGTIQGVVDNFLGGGNLFGQQVQRDQMGIAVPPGMAQPGVPGAAPGVAPPGDNSLGGLSGILGQLMGGNGAPGGFDLTAILSQVGTALTGNMQPRPGGIAGAPAAGTPANTAFVPNAQGTNCGAAVRTAGPPQKMPRFHD